MIESQPPTSGFKERVRVERYVAAFGCCCGHSAASAVPSSNNKKKEVVSQRSDWASGDFDGHRGKLAAFAVPDRSAWLRVFGFRLRLSSVARSLQDWTSH